jgi:hypothetical protein
MKRSPRTQSGDGSAVVDVEDRTEVEGAGGRETEPPRGPLPAGATREDYVGGDTPHKSRVQDEKDKPAVGRKNELV